LLATRFPLTSTVARLPVTPSTVFRWLPSTKSWRRVMLNNRTLVQVLPLAQKLVAAGKTVTALENTPLALINDCASVHSLFVDGKTIDDYSHEQIFETLVNSTRSTGEDGINEHAALRQTVVTNAARAVNQAMSMARNMVVPDINRVLKTVQELTDGFVSTLLEPF